MTDTASTAVSIPVTSPARFREVRVRLTVFDVTEISIPNCRFTCSFFLEASWEDGQLQQGDLTSDVQDPGKWDRQFPYRASKDEAKRWTPRLDFDNIVELKDKEDWFRIYTRTWDGRTDLPTPVVCYRLRATGVFRERFELQLFPFDSQDLQIQMVSRHPFDVYTLAGVAEDSHSAVKLIKNVRQEYQCVSPGDDKDKFTLFDEYAMSPDIVELQQRTLPQHSTTAQVYPLLVLSMKVTRRPRFYLWHVYLPMSAFVFLTFPVLLLGIDELSNRLQNIFALLLAAISYKGWLGDALPRCSYLTELDHYVLLCIALIFLAGFESSVVFILHKRILDDGRRAAVDDAEDYLGMAALLAWSAYCWYLYRRGIALEKCPPQTGIEQLHSNVAYRQSVNSFAGFLQRGMASDRLDRSRSSQSTASTMSASMPPDFHQRPASAVQQRPASD